MSPEIVAVAWSRGASPEAMAEALGEEALAVAVLEALLEDPDLRENAVAALRAQDAGSDGPRR